MFVQISPQNWAMHYKMTTTLARVQKRSLQNSAAEIFFQKSIWMLPISRYLWTKCSKLLSINTYRSLYKFGRLPFGVKVTPAMDIKLNGLEFVIAYLDDILMNSQSAEQQKAHMYEVFKRIQDSGFWLIEGKCNFLWKK